MSERTWNFALALAVLICVGAWGLRISQAPEAPDLSSEVYTVGETVPSVPGLNFGDRSQTLVLFASSECPACSDSMPFYVELRSMTQNASSPVGFAVISFEDEKTLDSYLRSNGLEPDAAASVSYEHFKLRRTPTLLLVDSKGVVEEYWIGRVTETRRTQIEEALNLLD